MWRFFDYTVSCEDCGWELSGKNGLGLAAQHHDKYGHTVHVQIVGSVTYASNVEHERLKQMKGMSK